MANYAKNFALNFVFSFSLIHPFSWRLCIQMNEIIKNGNNDPSFKCPGHCCLETSFAVCWWIMQLWTNGATCRQMHCQKPYLNIYSKPVNHNPILLSLISPSCLSQPPPLPQVNNLENLHLYPYHSVTCPAKGLEK